MLHFGIYGENYGTYTPVFIIVLLGSGVYVFKQNDLQIHEQVQLKRIKTATKLMANKWDCQPTLGKWSAVQLASRTYSHAHEEGSIPVIPLPQVP